MTWRTNLSRGLLIFGLAAVLGTSDPAIAASSSWEKTWAELKAAAHKEGIVVFRTGSSETKIYRQKQPEMEKILGIKIQLLSGSSNQLAAKEVASRRAGRPIADIWIGGPSPIVNTFVPAHAVQHLEPLLVNPEVKDPTKWLGGDLPWASDWTLAYGANANHGLIVYNPKLVNPEEFTSFMDLLNPKWKGKIAMRDPREDGVQSPRTFFYVKLGKTFYNRLFDEIHPVIAQDARTAAEWVARGKYPICIMGCNRAAERAQAQGLSIQAVFPKVLKEGYPLDMGGNGMTAMANPPHPNAQKYFINWFLSREGQIYYQKATGNYSLRNDIPRDGVEPINMIKADEVQYYWYGWKYPGPRDESQDFAIELMKRHGFQ
jgi:iron(III) transport system substrate-binding protein